MPIQPIDLQTLFAHINQVGKEQASIKEGLLAQQAAQQVKKELDAIKAKAAADAK